MEKTFGFTQAQAWMEDGRLVSCVGGTFDYYEMVNGFLYGLYSASDEPYPIELTPELRTGRWYLV